MGTIVAQTIINQMVTTLYDDAHTKWTEAELLGYLNDGQANIVLHNRSAYVVTAAVQQAAGTKQTIPAAGISFRGVRRNMGAAGATPGRVVRPTTFEDLNNTRPDWHSEAAAGVAVNFLYDPENPKVYYVSPPQPSSPHYLEIVYSSVPPSIALISDVITIDDVFKTALYNYGMMRAWLKASDNMDVQKAAVFGQAYLQELGVKATGDAAFSAIKGTGP
jgi:hypothetical protein